MAEELFYKCYLKMVKRFKNRQMGKKLSKGYVINNWVRNGQLCRLWPFG